ncbi:unnamed protein product [Chilo suppressalis]|uniref:Uncharacterized protein n=1 Tax=Chilo suppressalis TaxID=168631 RepID=A0ABN8B511_CHISP|nr:unnamed protein product [Chilo suppressalis]
MEEDEAAAAKAYLEAEMAQKEEELRILEEMSAATGFTPRHSLARSPPRDGDFVTPGLPPQTQRSRSPSVNPGTSTKRALASPEEVQAVPPIGGILTSQPRAASDSNPPAPRTPDPTPDPSAQGGLASLDKLQLLEMVHKALKGIGSITKAANKLNMTDKGTVASHSQDILAAVAALELRLADAEHQANAVKLQVAAKEIEFLKQSACVSAPQPSLPQVPSYANMLKLPRGKAPIPVQPQGPAVIFYPADESLKSSEDTKRTLQNAIKPGSEGIRIQSVRMVGKSGVVIRTANLEAAQKLKAAAPPSLKAADSKTGLPRIALRFLRSDISEEDFLVDLQKVNLSDDPEWSLDKVKQSCKVALKKEVGTKFLYILECTMPMRDKLIRLGKVYIGWDEAEVSDHVRATCCLRCQQYGHPEKYCRAKEMVCGRT